MYKQVNLRMSPETYDEAQRMAIDAGLSLPAWFMNKAFAGNPAVTPKASRTLNLSNIVKPIYMPELDILYASGYLDQAIAWHTRSTGTGNGRGINMNTIPLDAMINKYFLMGIRLTKDYGNDLLYLRKEMLCEKFDLIDSAPAETPAEEKYQSMPWTMDYRFLGAMTKHVTHLVEKPPRLLNPSNPMDGMTSERVHHGLTYATVFDMAKPMTDAVYMATLEHYDNLTKRGLIWHRPFSREDLMQAMDCLKEDPTLHHYVWHKPRIGAWLGAEEQRMYSLELVPDAKRRRDMKLRDFN